MKIEEQFIREVLVKYIDDIYSFILNKDKPELQVKSEEICDRLIEQMKEPKKDKETVTKEK